MAVQLALQLPTQDGQTLEEAVRFLMSTGSTGAGSVDHAHVSAAITERHFSEWRGRVLSGTERRRVHAYFHGVLRRRIISGADAQAREARSRLVARSIEQDLVQAGWERAQAARQAYAAAGIALSA
ncbi:MAG: hypothetical protein ACYC2X_05040 [Coriobacteriia bacterium]